MVVETPAGSNRVLHYDARSNDFQPELRAGTERRVAFLPYPANAGFIPSTRLPASKLHPLGRPQPALVLAESQPAGTVFEVLPLALLLLDNGGEMESVVLTVPARPSQRNVPVTSWQELVTRYPAARETLRLWYQHTGEPGEVRVVGWRGPEATEQQIRAALKP
ncbi:inorganic diphosphatase [Hymenobacter latericus]|uniref:inorganic diphosphatase n=1 Tax=Hymenobacter sp. YIM 151858-1 TaxID=2987688 RepID=UPI0022268AD0|nr:inorganic diphosphatase [Hymenobacter sp. YIM 151858-1]UYZ59148.1 inorganic diphosphatase [Hymenobacter sp. YIM 151858-1]